MSTNHLSMPEEVFRKYSVPASKQVRAVYVHAGTLDERSLNYWRNRSGLKKFFELIWMVPDESGTALLPAAYRSPLYGIPLVVSMGMPAGKIMLAMGDGTVCITDEPKEGEE